MAFDGVEDFLFTCATTTQAWPHEPAVVECQATEGGSWRLRLSADGARSVRLPRPGADPDVADASLRGTAGELVLARYNRIPVASLELDGDRRLLDLVMEWDPDA